MKKSLLTATLTIAAVGATLGGACLATGNCQAKSNTVKSNAVEFSAGHSSTANPSTANASTTLVTADSPITLAAQKAAAQKAEAQKAAPKAIKWYTSLDSALKESKRTGKPVFADFYADWCPPCKLMNKDTFPDPKVIAESQQWVMLKVDTEKYTDLAVQYGITSLPTLAVLRADGKPVAGVGGFLGAEQFVEFLQDTKKKMK